MSKMSQVLVYLTTDLKQSLDEWAAAHAMNRGQAIRFIINQFLKEELKNGN